MSDTDKPLTREDPLPPGWLQAVLTRLRPQLCRSVSVAALYARSPVAHKWKSPLRFLVVRESLAWRVVDLGEQIEILMSGARPLGPLILLRSALESVCLLVYLNEKIEDLIAGRSDFLQFEEASRKLLMGSKDELSEYQAINILTVLAKADKKHGGLEDMHRKLSEVCHPNFAGVVGAYSTADRSTMETTFGNNIEGNHGWLLKVGLRCAFEVFELEYNRLPRLMEHLERWLEQNDAQLESLRSRSDAK